MEKGDYMTKSEYDAVIQNFAGSYFTAFYKKGINLKLSTGFMVVNIWKPGKCKYDSTDVYTDAMIEISGRCASRLQYSDFKKLEQTVEAGIDYLNQEKENLIDREKIGTYEHRKADPIEKKKTVALKYADLEVGGIYLDKSKKKWVFLGKGTLFENGIKTNRGDYINSLNESNIITYNEYMYLLYPKEVQLIETGTNEFTIETIEQGSTVSPVPDTYAAKKRFFEKVGQLPMIEEKPLTFKKSDLEYCAFNGLDPHFSNEMPELKSKGL